MRDNLKLLDFNPDNTMVEGHGVHRVATRHKQLLLGKKFAATSPNGRFADGARAIHGKKLCRIEAIGKNLFYFFGGGKGGVVHVVHIHFGMSGRFATFPAGGAPPVKATTRLVLRTEEGGGIVAHLSAMTVEMGDRAKFDVWSAKLGPDPLRDDADFERLWNTCGMPDARAGKAPIGAVLMDQSKVAGVGNIYRAEILFKAGVHPEQPANQLGRERFEAVWYHCVDLMRKGVQTGSILTVDTQHKKLDRTRRRYVYNQSKCLLCKTKIKSWDMRKRTCYACFACQPMLPATRLPSSRAKQLRANTDVKVFASRCAPEVGAKKGKAASKKGKAGSKKKPAKKPAKKKVKLAATAEKAEKVGKSAKTTRGRKKRNRSPSPSSRAVIDLTVKKKKRKLAPRKKTHKPMRSAAAAALEKIRAGEKRNVEHVALADEVSLAVIAKHAKSKKKQPRRRQRVAGNSSKCIQ